MAIAYSNMNGYKGRPRCKSKALEGHMDLEELIKKSGIGSDDLASITRNIAKTPDIGCRKLAEVLAILAHLRGGERPHEEILGLEDRP